MNKLWASMESKTNVAPLSLNSRMKNSFLSFCGEEEKGTVRIERETEKKEWGTETKRENERARVDRERERDGEKRKIRTYV